LFVVQFIQSFLLLQKVTETSNQVPKKKVICATLTSHINTLPVISDANTRVELVT